MQINAITRSALVVAIDLALQPIGRFAKAHEIAGRQDMTPALATETLEKLERAGLIHPNQARTGYRLARDVELISVFAVLSAVDRSLCSARNNSAAQSLRLDNEAQTLATEVWSDFCAPSLFFFFNLSLAEVIYSGEAPPLTVSELEIMSNDAKRPPCFCDFDNYKPANSSCIIAEAVREVA